MQTKKVVITGSSGYIGRHVVKRMLDLGHEIYVIDLSHEGIDSRAKIIDIDIFNGDENVFDKIGKPDVCIHLAWKDGFSHNSDAHMEMLSSHYTFINNLLKGGLKQIAVMGSMHEIGYFEGAVDEFTATNPLSFYGVAKNSLRQSTKLLCEKHGAVFQWLRAYYIIGDDSNNKSIFSKICQMEAEGKSTFPFVSGKNKYDFLHIDDLAEQIALASSQMKIDGIINVCSGKPVALADKVVDFIAERRFNITPSFGEFPERAYDSPAIWGDNTKILEIMEREK